MTRIIAGATGFIGQELVKRWIEQGIKIVVIGRSRKKIKQIFNAKVEIWLWDELKDIDLEKLKNVQALVNLAGTSIAERRWNAKRKAEIIQSRVSTTKIISKFCASKEYSIPLLNASAVGIYGFHKQISKGLPPSVDEDSPLTFTEKHDFLSDVCHKWEKATSFAKDSGNRVVNMRLGVVLDKNGGALPKMSLPFHFFIGGPIGGGNQPIAWISLEDTCRAIEFLIEHPDIYGAVNLVSPGCVKQSDFAKALGQALKRPGCIPTPSFIPRIILGQLAEELLLEGQNVQPSQLLKHKFSFKHQDIHSALKDIY